MVKQNNKLKERIFKFEAWYLYMLLMSSILILLSSAVTFRRDKAISFNRITMSAPFRSLYECSKNRVGNWENCPVNQPTYQNLK